MKAIALQSADRPATLTEVPKPEVGDGDVLVAVRAASVNGFDVYQAGGSLVGMFEHDLPTVIGRDFAGVVEGVGPVSQFTVGAEVLGFIPSAPPLKSGSFAEYVSGGSGLVLAPKPAELDFDQAAALPLAGSAALDLLEAVDGQEGDVLLIVGATGGVGSFAVQLADQRGLKVIATARPDEDAFVRELGASETIDYTARNVRDAVLERHADGIAGLIDVVDQTDALTELAAVVRSGGHVASTLGAADVERLAERGITGHNVNASPTVDKLRSLATLAGSGALKVPIQGTYPIEQATEALQVFQQGTRGKLIVRP
jgi:NADPH:quinone reductase